MTTAIRNEHRSFMCPESSNLGTVTYWTGTKRLRVAFKNGAEYDYAAVPLEVYEQLRDADSVGMTFDALVKKGGFEFKKVEPV